MDALRACIPRSKCDTERAQAAVAAGYPRVTPILFELLEWRQDGNWPGAHVLAPFLASIGAPLAPHLRRVLATDDELWKYWVISRVLRESRELAQELRPELERLATSPTEPEAREELQEVAREVLDDLPT